MKRILQIALVCLLPLGFSAEVVANPYAPQRGYDLQEPAQVLRNGVEALIGYLDNHPGPNAGQLRAYLEREVLPYFDFARMAQWAAGPIGRQLTAPQRQVLTRGLKRRFLTAMTEQLSGYQKSRLKYLRPRGNPSRGEVTLGVQVFRDGAYPVQLDFKLYLSERGWRVYDVVANGSSAVSYYRSEFMAMARRYGVPGLLERLAN
jgi:phospholipid transport system substrate-binding protein